jgi:hypothetical protein
MNIIPPGGTITDQRTVALVRRQLIFNQKN